MEGYEYSQTFLRSCQCWLRVCSNLGRLPAVTRRSFCTCLKCCVFSFTDKRLWPLSRASPVRAEQPKRAAIKILQCNNELCQYELRQVVPHAPAGWVSTAGCVSRRKTSLLTIPTARPHLHIHVHACIQDGDVESVSQSKRVVKLKLEAAPKLCLIIKKPSGKHDARAHAVGPHASPHVFVLRVSLVPTTFAGCTNSHTNDGSCVCAAPQLHQPLRDVANFMSKDLGLDVSLQKSHSFRALSKRRRPGAAARDKSRTRVSTVSFGFFHFFWRSDVSHFIFLTSDKVALILPRFFETGLHVPPFCSDRALFSPFLRSDVSSI